MSKAEEGRVVLVAAADGMGGGAEAREERGGETTAGSWAELRRDAS